MDDRSQILRIFISSPGDVSEERDGAKRVIEGLRKRYPNATLQPVLWEELALPATASFQETIDFLLEREPIDIAVFILWSRLGSPLGAAIARPDGTSYRSGTEREFDLMLAAYEQSGQQRPTILAYVRNDDAGFKQRLTESPKTELAELIDQQRMAEAFVVEQFQDAEGRNFRAYQTYREPIGFLQQFRLHLRGAIDELLDVDSVSWIEEPYRGLETFEIEHAPIFYGREEETCDLLGRLRDQQLAGCAFVVLVGASGSGKSSLARAGIAATLVQHRDDEGVLWQASEFIPTLAHQSLHHALVQSLGEVLPEMVQSDSHVDRIAKGLAENPQLTTDLTIIPAFESNDKSVRLLLILDQMEELWTDRHTTEEHRESFLTAIKALAESGHVVVLATLRSDFYHDAQTSPTFLSLKGTHGHVDLLAPSGSSTHRLITEPARLAGLQFERDEQSGRSLDELILADASTSLDALPLLEYTLSELYRRRDEDRRLLTFAGYIELGGVEGAIGKRAEETFLKLPAHAQEALHEILPLLIAVDVAGEQSAVRRRAKVADLKSTPSRTLLYEQLTEARFLTTDRLHKVAIASLAHEALLRRWDRIDTWIDANRQDLQRRARVEQSQQRWEQQNQDDSLLLAEGLPLDEARKLIEDAPSLLAESTVNYIQASLLLQVRRASLARRRKRMLTAVVATLLGIIVVGAFVTRRQRQREVTKSLVTAVTTARGIAFPPTVDDLDNLPRKMVVEELNARFKAAKPKEKLPLAFALARYGDVRTEFLLSNLRDERIDEFDNFVSALRGVDDESLDKIKEVANTTDDSIAAMRQKARFAMLSFFLGDPAPLAGMCQPRTDPIQRTVMINECSSWCGDLIQLRKLTSKVTNPSLRSAICLIVGSLSIDRLTPEQQEAARERLVDWYRHQPDAGTHSAAAWALTKWDPDHDLSDLSGLEADQRRQWHINDVGITMVQVQAGEFRGTNWLRDDMNLDFLISDREVNVALFQRFVDEVKDDPNYPATDKLATNLGSLRSDDQAQRTLESHPRITSWEDAMKFCNWLSRKEGRATCYRRVDRWADPEQIDRSQLQALEKKIAAAEPDSEAMKSLQSQKNEILFRLRRYQESLTGFNELSEHGVDDASLHRYRAILLAREGDAQAARDSLGRFKALISEQEATTLLSTIVESWLGNGQSALKSLRTEVEDYRSDGSFLYNAACACSQSLLAATHHGNVELANELKRTAREWLYASFEQGQNPKLYGMDPNLDPVRLEENGLLPVPVPNAFMSTPSAYEEVWLVDLSRNGYRLPTAAEWTHACAAGTSTEYSFGDSSQWLRGYGTYLSASPQPCGSKMPNAWGLFDMHGNVWEWCHASRDTDSPDCVILGGSYSSLAEECVTSLSRYRSRDYHEGFRVVLTSSNPQSETRAGSSDETDEQGSKP